MKYTMTVYKDNQQVNVITCEDEAKVYKELATCYMNCTKVGYADMSKITDHIVNGVHTDLFDLYFDRGDAGKYRYHYEFDFSLRG